MAEGSGMDLDNTTPNASAPTQELDSNTGLDLGNVYKQCSTARMAASTMTFSVKMALAAHTLRLPPTLEH
jgi:hypothetical protein